MPQDLPTHVCITFSVRILVGGTLERCRRLSYSKIKIPPTPENPVAVILWRGKTGKVRCSTTKQCDGTITLDHRYGGGKLSYQARGTP